MRLTKQDVLRINEWTENNNRARDDYYTNPFRHCRVNGCDGIHGDESTLCAEHLEMARRLRHR